MNYTKENKKKVTELARKKIPESNIIVSQILLVFSTVSFLLWMFYKFGILASKGSFVDITTLATSFIFVIVSVICLLKKGKGIAFKYIFILLLSFFWLQLDITSGYKSKLLLTILIIVSLRYYNRKFIVFTYISCLFSLLASVWCNAFLYTKIKLIDLNLVFFNKTYTVKLNGFITDGIINLKPDSYSIFSNGFKLVFIPNMVFLTGITVLAIRFMRYNLIYMLKAEEMATLEANQRLELSDMKTKVMLSQVKPHFIYNTLSSIALLCKKDSDRAKKLTLNFSEYLRNNLDTLNSSENSVCSFSEELEHIKCYLEIELVRFEDRLNVEYDIRVSDFPVPTLSIQPIVENAVKHGVSEKVKGGTVKISSEETEDYYVITVTDDGVGFDKNTIENDQKEHIGISNISKRIDLFGGTFTIESTIGVGTKAVVLIPKTEVIL